MRRVAPRLGAMAMPGPRSVHTYPTPSLGGGAIFVGFLAAMAVASQLGQFHEMFQDSSEPVGVLLAAGVMFPLGTIDDVRKFAPPANLAVQTRTGSNLSCLAA